LFITGEDDILVHPETIRIAAELIPHSEFKYIKEAGHSSYYERPEKFNRIVQTFLEKHQWI
jgi:pimeloyl-ACP methyl ester carboxylesterase